MACGSSGDILERMQARSVKARQFLRDLQVELMAGPRGE
jgi:hypothetical protein